MKRTVLPSNGSRLRQVWLFVAGMALAFGVTRLFPAWHSPAQQHRKNGHRIEARGPWGVLTETTVMLHPPAEFLRGYDPTQEIRWAFGGISLAEFRTYIQSLGLTAHQEAALLDPSCYRVANDSIVVRPPLDVVREMAPGPRQKLYELLARTPQNMAQCFPYVFRDRFEDHFAGSGMSPSMLNEVRRMIYQKGDVSVFADLPYFQFTAPSNEVIALARCISRIPAVLVELQINESSDVNSLARYWVLPEQSTDVEPMLRSLAGVRGGATLNIATFLPPVPQSLLNTFPRQRSDGFPRNANCVWSTMNFFNAQPDHRFVEEQFTGQALTSKYHSVSNADAFGDIIMLYHPEPGGGMRMVHMCVHVADDLVFTKNGGDVFQPWVIMRLPDVKGLFVSESDLKTAVFRRNS